MVKIKDTRIPKPKKNENLTHNDLEDLHTESFATERTSGEIKREIKKLQKFISVASMENPMNMGWANRDLEDLKAELATAGEAEGVEYDPDQPESMQSHKPIKSEIEAGEDWDEAKYGGSKLDKHGQSNHDFEPQSGDCPNCGHPYHNHSTVDSICYGGGDGKLGEGPLGGCPCGMSYPFVRKDWNEGNQ